MNLFFVTIAASHRWPRSRHCSGSGPDGSRQTTSRYAVAPINPGSTTIPWGLLKQPDKHELPSCQTQGVLMCFCGSFLGPFGVAKSTPSFGAPHCVIKL